MAASRSHHGVKAARALAAPALLFAALEAVSLLVGFLTQPLLMRALGPAAYGDYALAAALGVVAVTLTDFGFNFAGVNRAIELASRPDAARRHFWAVQAAKAVAGGATLLATLAWAWASGAPQARAVLVAMAVGVGAAWLFPSWFLLSRHRLMTIAGSLLVARTICLAAVAAWVRGPDQLELALLLTLGAPMLAGLLVLADRALRAQFGPVRVSAGDVGDALRCGLSTLWLSGQAVVSSALLQSLLFALAGSVALGVYAAADRVRAGLQGLFTAFGTAVFPRFVQHVVEGDHAGAAQAGPLLRLQLASAGALALLLWIFAPEVVRVVAGPDFVAAAPVLRVLVLALLSTTLLSALGVQVLLPRGLSKRYALATLVVVLLQALALRVLVPPLGAVGAAWALVLCEAAVGVYLYATLPRAAAA